MSELDQAFLDFVRECGLVDLDEVADWSPVSGGVSSDLWRVRTKRSQFCVKRALAQLKVAAEWYVPLDRNANEWNYLSALRDIAPKSAPRLVAHDPARGMFAMDWLPAENYPVWKTRLLGGSVDPSFASKVGEVLGRIHQSTAGSDAFARRFATDSNFHALRIEPYLLATAAKNPDLAHVLTDLAERTGSLRIALVHGDVSPKNILVGPDAPVFLDAECAWYGDPAFDLAFCLNHLMIKARIVEGQSDALEEAINRLCASYFAHVDWEPRSSLEQRAATLLPALALARVDGKSPVEYLNDAQQRSLRQAARLTLGSGIETLEQARQLLVRP